MFRALTHRPCSSCIYAYYNPRDVFPLRQCLQFKEKETNLHALADQCRKDERKCGPNGTYWFRKLNQENESQK